MAYILALYNGLYGGGLIDFDDVSAAVDGFWSGCRGLSYYMNICVNV